MLAFRKENNIVDVSGKLINEDTLTDLNGQLSRARQKTADAHAKLTHIQEIINSSANNGDIEAVLGNEFQDPILASLGQQYIQLSTQLKEMTVTYGDTLFEVKNIRVKIQTLKDAMNREFVQVGEPPTPNTRRPSKARTSLEAQVQSAIDQVQRTNSAQVKLHAFEDAAKNYTCL